ncbi:MAG: rane protein [Bacteroidetes bacterium]|jgi:hypothetical protein|nr:rane protein [Bacteroidota bacterium]
MKDFVKRNKGILLALLVLLIYLSPNIFMAYKARYLVHDNLDSNVVWYKNLAESGKMFADNKEIVPNSLAGIPRGCYPSELNFLHLFYLWFSPLFAYNLNIVIMHLVAFFGMYLLTRKYLFKNEPQWLPISISLLFALLPFWPSGALAITGQPLLLFAFLNILNYELNWKNWLIILIIPLYSVLILSNFFFLILIGLVFLVYSFRKRKINFWFIASMILFVLTSVIAEHKLFEMQFIEHFDSHRSAMKHFGTLNLKGVIGVSLKHFMKGQYHFHSLQFPFSILLAATAFIFAKLKRDRFILFGLLLSAYFMSFLLVLPDWMPMQAFMLKHNLLKSLSLRFYSLFPILWFIILAYSSWVLVQSRPVAKKILPFVFVGMGAFSFFSLNDTDYNGSEFAENSFYRTYFDKANVNYNTFEDHYQTTLFSEVKAKVPAGDYNIGCIGFEPEIAQYNGYNTIDGYFFYYAKTYNEFMNSINEKELAKGKVNAVYSRCYLVSNDLEKGKNIIDDLQLDYDKMKEIRTKYIFSSRKIINERLTNEQFVGEGNNGLFIYTIQ